MLLRYYIHFNLKMFFLLFGFFFFYFAGDSLNVHNGIKFSTFDKDQDASEINCAKKYLGAFWYNAWHHTNPNGVYRWGADNTLYAVGVEWSVWKGYDYSLNAISFKIRPVQ